MAEIEHFISPELKFQPYEKFQLVKDLEVNLWCEKDQLESRTHSKIKLNEAISQVNLISGRPRF